MQKIGCVVLMSLFGLASLEAAERGETGKKTESEPVASSATADAKQSDTAGARLGTGVTRNAVISASGTSGAVALSRIEAGGFAPITPFVSYALSGIDTADEEFQRLLQQVHERELRMLQNPEYRDMLRAQQRLSLHHSHADLPALLQIPKEQAEQLLDLLAEQQVRWQVAGRPMASKQPNAEAMQQYAEKVRETREANDAEIAALLGAAKFQEWKEYEQNAMARFQIQRLQQQLPPDARLQPDQRRMLVSALATEQRRLLEERAREIPPNAVPDENWQRRMQEGHAQRMASMNERLLERAASILSPKQLEHFEVLLKQELENSARPFFFAGQSAPATP